MKTSARAKRLERVGRTAALRRRFVPARTRSRVLVAPLVLLSCLGAAGRTAAADEPTLDLSALLREAESSSPGLAAVDVRRQASALAPDRISALPDPWLQVSYANESLDRLTMGSSPDAGLTLTWTQELPWPGKRRLAMEAARAETGMAAAEVGVARAELRSRIKESYVRMHRIDRLRALVSESRQALVSLRDAALTRYESAGGPLAGVLRASAEISRSDAEAAALTGERSALESELAALLGRPSAAGLSALTVRPAVEAPADDELERRAVERSPRLAAVAAAAAWQERRVAAARRDLLPDLMWTASYTHRGGLDPMVMGMVGFRLPVWKNRKQVSAIQQSELDASAAKLDLAQAEVETRGRVRSSLRSAAAAESRARLLAETTIPLDRAAVEAASSAFASGPGDFPTVLEAIRARFQDGRELEDLRAERALFLVALEPLTGQELVFAGEGSERAGNSSEGVER